MLLHAWALQVTLSYWVLCRVWCYDSDLNLPPHGCQCQDCQDWARHDTKYKQKYHSKCKLFLYEREIAALNLAWVVAVSWVRDEDQNIPTEETDSADSVNWKWDKIHIIKVIDKILRNDLYDWKLNNFFLTFSFTAQQDPGSRALLYAYKWVLTSNVQTSDIKVPMWYTTQYCSSNIISISSHQCVSSRHLFWLKVV